MQQPPRQFTYALLGRDHSRMLTTYSADITLHRIDYPNEKFTYLYYGFIEQGTYVRKELAMGDIELEWNAVIDKVADTLKNVLCENYPVARDFSLRLVELKKNEQAHERFESTMEKFADSAFTN